VVKVRDADTIEIALPGSTHVWAIRLIDVWAAERNTDEGKAAKAGCERILSDVGAGELAVSIPAPHDVRNLLRNLTFDRVPGYVWLDAVETLNARLVRDGLGYATRAEQQCHSAATPSPPPEC
jgi:endonuclease YncB( thermonuclease family)